MYMLNNIIYVDFKRRKVLNCESNSFISLMMKFVINIFLTIKGFFEPKKVSPPCKRIQN